MLNTGRTILRFGSKCKCYLPWGSLKSRQGTAYRQGLHRNEFMKLLLHSSSMCAEYQVENMQKCKLTIVMCEYSKFLNTYLTVISRAIDTRFVCTLPATSCRTHLSVEPSAAPRVFLPLPLLWVPWPRTHARTGGGSSCACVRAPSAWSRPWHLMAL